MAYLPYGYGCNIFEEPCEHEVISSFSMVPRAGFTGTWPLTHQSSSDIADPKTYRIDMNGFRAFLDLHQFESREISVKTINHTIVVECKHETREDDHGLVERYFVRKYNLPIEFDMSTVKSSLSKDGVLFLEAPRSIIQREERKIEIQHTEKPSFLMSLLSNRAHSMLKRSHSIPSDDEED